MGKKFNVDVSSFTMANDMDNIYAGATPTETTPKADLTNDVKKVENKQKNNIINYKKTNGTNKKDNYTISFKIDEDIKDYLQNILWINRKTKNEYVNDLIRADMLKRLNLNEDASYEVMQKEWEKFKKKNDI